MIRRWKKKNENNYRLIAAIYLLTADNELWKAVKACYLHERANEKGECWPAIPTIARELEIITGEKYFLLLIGKYKGVSQTGKRSLYFIGLQKSNILLKLDNSIIDKCFVKFSQSGYICVKDREEDGRNDGNHGT